MRLILAAAVLIATAVPAAAQQVYCPYGQRCQPVQPVPFPVINPGQVLGNVLTYPLRRGQQATLTPPPGRAPIAIPPPVLPPGTGQ